jgi:hypothetical protein
MTKMGRTQWLGAALVIVVVGGLLMVRDVDQTATVPLPPSNPETAAPIESTVADVNLEVLTAAHVELGDSERNPFRFRPRPVPSPPPAARPTAPPAVFAPPAPTGPPPPPPIALRYIGLVDAPTQAGRVAMLSDGRGNVFYGKEGDIIEGRYRVLRVGPDSAELAYLDGRGRQTIRLSGQ